MPGTNIRYLQLTAVVSVTIIFVSTAANKSKLTLATVGVAMPATVGVLVVAMGREIIVDKILRYVILVIYHCYF